MRSPYESKQRSMPEPDWWTEGLCMQTDPEAFFPEKGGSNRDAKRICDECPVRAQCLEYAMRTEQQHGIWGGLSVMERRNIRLGRAAA